VKQFSDLTPKQQANAVAQEKTQFLRRLCEGEAEFSGELGDRVDLAKEEAERMQTPWFLGEIIMEDPMLADVVQAEAEEYARKSLYREDGEIVADGVW
jgi:hypothetical protein